MIYIDFNAKTLKTHDIVNEGNSLSLRFLSGINIQYNSFSL